jgi:hypothetical protein
MMMAISTGVSVVGQLQQGQAQRKAANAEARQQEIAAAQERDAAMVEAARIRKAGDRASGAARAQLAASGIDVGSGTALVIDEDITRESNTDAEYTLLTGSRRAGALNYSASQSRARGRNAVTSSVLGSVSTGLQGWKAVKQQKAPADIDPYGWGMP